MGISINALACGESQYVRSVKTMCTIVAERIFSPIDRRLYTLTPNYFREKKALNVLHSYTEQVIEERIKYKAGNPLKDFHDNKKLAFLDLLLESTIDGKPLTRSELREEVDTFMFEVSIFVSFELCKKIQNKYCLFHPKCHRSKNICDIR